ncbi:MAG: glycoside hydrolase family 88 protein [Planctomycetota bacterium]
MIIRSRVTPLSIATGLLLIAAVGFGTEHSALWGGHGEKWTPESRLPDFSFAGYHCGEKSLPVVPPGVSVKDFGAKGDGVADDSQAFLDALAKVRSGAIEVPAGRYRITRMIEITCPNVVLRGAGPDRSVLFFPTPLNDIKPNWGATTTGLRTSNYSWSGGFLTLRGSFGSKTLAGIVADAKRGNTSVRVSSVRQLRVGQRVDVFQSDTAENTLAVHLYSGDSGPVRNLKGGTRASLVSRITSIDGDRIHLDRPLRCDVQAAWHPRLRSFEPTVTESGIENLGFEFPSQPYKGHFTELGFNAIGFYEVADCWVRNVRTRNADSGLFIGGSFNTVQGVVLESQRAHDNQNCVGHHGISLGGGDHLVTDFDFRNRYIHDITVSHHCSGNVCSHGRGVDLALDHHGYAPYENLFTDLDAGGGLRLWKCGGGANLGKHCGARGTFWNIRAERPQRYPDKRFGPLSMNLVAVQTDQPSEKNPAGKWFEAIDPRKLEPQNLHKAQLARRLATNIISTKDNILTMMHKVNAYQLEHPWKATDHNWIRGTYYTGVMAAYHATKDERYLEQAMRWGVQHQWQPGTEHSGGNKLTCGQTWIELHAIKKDPEMISPLIKWLDSGKPNTRTKPASATWLRTKAPPATAAA